ncbi:dynein axonemal assembly factor 4-like isoform X1 [Argiope bruennichi]|uniref:dynein axonemal assembly factor 4-like isoform X1 n=1 Tax=Argiope bruennichi TaxID=94029 RepID=UPI0024950895|nr:dynein axonemal assembly factor 4-like isoform X1 [Argiope bruennichi]
MPLIIKEKEVEWHESKDKILIVVPLTSRVDVKPSVLITSNYLKVSSPPYLWECFLFNSIDPEKSFVRITSDNVSFELQKSMDEVWNDLSHPEAGSEIYRKEQRETAFEENQKRLQNSLESKQQRKQTAQRESIRKQMEVEELERQIIEREKMRENQKAAADIKRKQEQLKANVIAQKRKQLQQFSDKIPPTRKSGHITVSFTPREFPTAARESQEAEEREWLDKQMAASASLKLDLSDLSPHERNPQWLKSKAESMFKKGDFRSAVNAYTLAIRMCPNLHSLHLGRSACHLNLRNLHKAVEDSSKALELLVPAVPSNANDRKEAHKIRGTAFQALELYVEGLMDFEAALKMDPNDKEIKQKADEVRNFIEKGT